MESSPGTGCLAWMARERSQWSPDSPPTDDGMDQAPNRPPRGLPPDPAERTEHRHF